MEHLQAPPPSSPEEFLLWAEGQEEKHEFIEGVVVMQAGASRDHERIAKNVFVALLQQVDIMEFDVNKGDFGVRIRSGNARESVLLPDVVVDFQSSDGKERATTTPLVVVEVLSPTTDLAHHVEKLRKYTILPSLMHYAVFSQDEPEVHLWRKTGDAWAVIPEVVRGMEATIAFPEIGAVLTLAEIYKRAEYKNVNVP